MWSRSHFTHPSNPFIWDENYPEYKEEMLSQSGAFKVVLFNTADNAIIRQIIVAVLGNGDLQVTLSVSPFKTYEIMKLCANFIESTQVKFSLYDENIEITCADEHTIKKIINLFKGINKKFTVDELSTDVINIFSKFTTLNTKKTQGKIVDSLSIAKSLEDIKLHRTESDSELALLNFMKEHSSGDEETYPIQSFRKLLVSDQNVNQHDGKGMTPLTIAAFCHQRIDLVELLLLQGANPFKRHAQIQCYNSYEMTKMPAKTEMRKTIEKYFSRPEKPLNLSKKPLMQVTNFKRQNPSIE